MARILLTGVSSGSGKTTVTCGLLRCLQNRGLQVTSLKCGPDYIDPMFHSKVLGARSGNLDPFFVKPSMLRWILKMRSAEADITVLEGAMGYYDGVGFTSDHSSWSVACETETPAVLVVDCKGMGCSVAAVLTGFFHYRMPSQIQGVLFNRLSPALYPAAAAAASEMGIRPLGYLPLLKDCSLESRHLGLVTASEIADLEEKINRLAVQMEQTIDIDGLLSLAESAPDLPDATPYPVQYLETKVTIGVAADRAFSFTYDDNLLLLQNMGCTLVSFSPLTDSVLPVGLDGLLLSGGYPELYARQLSENETMRQSIRAAIARGMPCIAECGGFLYLHEFLEGADGIRYPMVGAVPGACKKGERLRRFGYVHLTARRDNLLCSQGTQLRGHEFHYWQSDGDGDLFHVEKASGTAVWDCGIGSENFYGGFPHFYFYGNPGMAERFAERCRHYGMERTASTDPAAG